MKGSIRSQATWLACLVLMQTVTGISCEQTRALQAGEHLDYEIGFDEKRAVSILNIFRVGKESRELIRKYESLDCNTPTLALDRRAIFFVLRVKDDKYYADDLYMYDGRTGLDRRLFKSTCEYAISPDARFVCFQGRGYVKAFPWRSGKGEDILAIPIVFVVDLTATNERKYDFSKSFLRDRWGAGVYIKYDEVADGFRLRFFMEDRDYSKGIISLRDFQYREDEK